MNRALVVSVSVARWLAQVANGLVLLAATVYFALALCVAYLKATGQIVEGQPMYFELRTPTWGALLVFQAICLAVIVACFVIRKLLRPRNR